MKKEDYLSQLKQKISVLSDDDIDRIIQYYSDYFEEAKDDEKVVRELGAVEKLGNSLISKYQVSVETVVVSESENKDVESVESEKTISEGALFYSYAAESVHNLYCNFGAAEVVAISGKKFSIETRGISEENLNCNLSPEGYLSINNTKKINLNFFSHDRTARVVPRILLTIPEKISLDKIRIVIGAGSFESKETSILYKNGSFEAEAGSLVLNNISGGRVNVHCGMGKVELEGKIKEHSFVDCGMGSVKISVSGDKEQYSYDAKVGLGDFKFNEIKKNGVGKVASEQKLNNHFSVNCGMGSVNIQISE